MGDPEAPSSLFALLTAPPALLALAATALALVYSKWLHIPSTERPIPFKWSVPPEASRSWTGTILKSPNIDPTRSDGPAPDPSPTHKPSDHIQAWDPSTGYYLGTYPAVLPSEIDGMIARAQKAQGAWKQVNWPIRRRVLRSLLKWVVDDMRNIAQVACRDTGKTMIDAAFGEILTTAEKLRWSIANGESALKPEPRSTNLLLAHKVSEVRFEPLGVVVAIVSWNYPFHNMLSPIIAALTAGNAIILKPSEHVVFSSRNYLAAVHSCLVACGIPYAEDLVQLAACLPEGSSYLAGAPGIKHVTFIGSEQIGRKVGVRAAEAGIPVTMELGGKDACIVLEDCDLGFFKDTFMRGTFQGAGQNCIGIERFIVADKLYPDFVALMEPRVAALRQGSSLSTSAVDVGAMLSDRGFATLDAVLSDAQKKGARVLCGGKRGHSAASGCSFWEPTLVVDVTADMDIVHTELFAPVMTVMRYTSVGEAIDLANGTRFGLGASVFGRSSKACEYIAERLECGMVSINDFGVFYLNQALPFGGVKASGHSRFSGPEGLRSLCSAKAVTRDRFHGIVQTPIPPLLRYPITKPRSAWKFLVGLVQVAFGGSLRERALGLVNILRAEKGEIAGQ